MDWATALRNDIRVRASAWATEQAIPHYTSLGILPTVLFERASDESGHGSFHSDSWRAILDREHWRERLTKPHSAVLHSPVALLMTGRRARCVWRASFAAGGVARLRSPLGVRTWQANAELRTLPGSGAGGTDGALVKFDKMPCDAEVHAYAGLGLSRGGQNERVEEP